MSRFHEADLTRLRRMPVADRATKVAVEDFARPLDPEAAAAMIAALPDQLAAGTLRAVVARTAAAHREGRPVVVMLGGHVVKVGVTPCLIELMERGVVCHVAMNGAAAIHDAEIARVGRTSEDVEAHLHQGTFGMVDETGDFMNAAISEGARLGEGLGECQGRALERDGLIRRTVYAEVPPRVEYENTPAARRLRPIFVEIVKWAEDHRDGTAQAGEAAD